MPPGKATSDLRRIDPQTGEILESLEMPPGVNVSGLESDGSDQFFCGGGKSGKVRVVRRPRPGAGLGRKSEAPLGPRGRYSKRYRTIGVLRCPHAWLKIPRAGRSVTYCIFGISSAPPG
jgi:hypothetical protein